jgi:ornithine cyclodeaminase/alanine dehydrogenase-like protein (mu-crystallin family)
VLTTFLSRGEVVRHARALHLLRELREAFVAQARDGASSTLSLDVPGPHGATALRHATLASIPAWSLTVRSVLRADARGSGAALHLYDGPSGRLLATMDAGHLGTLSQSVVGALAVDALARSEAAVVALLGGGPIASNALKALRLVRSLQRVTLFDPDLVSSTSQALALHQALSVPVRACESAEEAVAIADVVVLTGRVRLPSDALRDGAHVTVMSAEQHAEAPLPDAVLGRARVFSEQRAPALPWAPRDVRALGEVLDGRAEARPTANALTIFLATTPPVVDLVAGWHVFEGARHDEALTRVDLDG